MKTYNMKKILLLSIISLILFQCKSDKEVRSDRSDKTTDTNIIDTIITNNLIHFELFKEENKNTKKSIVNNLYNQVLVNAKVLGMFENSTFDLEKLQNTTMGLQLASQESKLSKEAEAEASSSKPRPRQRQSSDQMSSEAFKLPAGFNLNDPRLQQIPGLDSLLQNPVMKNTMNTMLETLQSEEINPMSMLTEIMSGNQSENGSLSRMMSKITSTLDDQIKSGSTTEAELSSNMMSTMTQMMSNPQLAQMLNPDANMK